MSNEKLAARLSRDKGEVLLTVAVPLGVTVVGAPPGLITKRNADHLGLTGDELVRIVRAMSLDPRYRDVVVRRGKSLRGAPPDQSIAYLRSAPSAAESEDDADGLLRELGYEALPQPRPKAPK